MVVYTNLPVFKKAYDLFLEIIFTTNKLQKSYKYTLGERLQTETLNLLISIHKANSSIPNRKYFITSAKTHIETVKLITRILYDLKQINSKRLFYINGYLQDISKQLTGWQKSANFDPKIRASSKV